MSIKYVPNFFAVGIGFERVNLIVGESEDPSGWVHTKSTPTICCKVFLGFWVLNCMWKDWRTR